MVTTADAILYVLLLLVVSANDHIQVRDLTPDFRFNIETLATAYDIERRTLQTHNISPHNYQSLDKQSALNQTKSPPNQSKMAADAKTEVMQQVRQQAALQNARFLVDVSTVPQHATIFPHFRGLTYSFCCTHTNLKLQKVNEHCFERAIPNPGSSISSAEQTSFTNCMEKYMAAWNTTSRQYLGHLQRGAGAGGM
jgi:import inner membrane translocase subunit TIM13